MEEENEIIFSLSKGECQLDSDCGPPLPEDIEYYAQEEDWERIDCVTGEVGSFKSPGSDFTTPLADIVEVKCGDGRWYDGWYACQQYPDFVNPPWGSPICRCAEPSDETEYNMPEGWYENVGKHLLVMFSCAFYSPIQTWWRNGDPNDPSTWQSYIDLPCSGIGVQLGVLSFGFLHESFGIDGPPLSPDLQFNTVNQGAVVQLGGGFCCENECQFCPCLYETCPMAQSRIDPPFPECLVGPDDHAFCVPNGWECLMYECNRLLGNCQLYNGWQVLNCVDLICNCTNPGSGQGTNYSYTPPCIQDPILIDKGLCEAGCTKPTPTGECITDQVAFGTQCRITGEGCANGTTCSKPGQRDPTRRCQDERGHPECQCSCQSSYLPSRIVKDFNWKGDIPP